MIVLSKFAPTEFQPAVVLASWVMGMTLLAGEVAAQPTPSPVTLRATEAFSPVSEPEFAPYYAENRSADRKEHGLAINTVRYGAQHSAAEVRFGGMPGIYDLVLWAVAEEDGESRYQIVLNDRPLELRINPESSQKRLPVPHRWKSISLAVGDRIRVIFQGHSNGRIPEGEGFAWSRGRWRALEIVAAP